MRNYFALLGFLLVLFSGCSNVPNESTANNRGDKVFETKANSKYGVTCLFHGEEVSVGDHSAKVIRYLTLRNDATGEEVKYDTVAPGAVMDAGAYFTNVWSPDEEYFVSLSGRTQGFCIVKTSEIMQHLKAKRCADFIRVRQTDGTLLWHGFKGWEGNSTLVFNVGLSGDQSPMKYDIVKGVLTNLDPKLKSIEAVNSKGQIAILSELIGL